MQYPETPTNAPDVLSPVRGGLVALVATALAVSAVGLGIVGAAGSEDELAHAASAIVYDPTTLTDGEWVTSDSKVMTAQVTLLPAENRVLLTPAMQESILPPLLDPASFPDGLGVPEPVLPSPVEPGPTPTTSPEPSPSADPAPGPDSELSLADYWFVGDSIAVAFHQYLGASEAQLSGRVGAGSSEITEAVLPDLSDPSSRSERVLLVALGTNDSLGYESNFESNVDALMAAAQATNRCVVWLTIHRVTEQANWASYNEVLRAQENKYPALRLVDLDGLVSSEPGLLYDDGVHLRPEGYERLWPLVSETAQSCASGLR